MALALFACGSSSESSEDSSGAPEASGADVAIFPDEVIEERIREKLKQPDGPIAIADLAQLTEFGVALDLYVTDLSGLEHLVNLNEFDMTQNKTSDISTLSSLTTLTKLNLTQNDIVDVSALAPLVNLTFLWAQDNEIVDISSLASLTKLTELNLQKNHITDISALANMTELSILNLTSNNIVDISPLALLPNLTLAELSQNDITDLSPLLDTPLGEGTRIALWGAPLDANSVDVVIPQLEAKGIRIDH
jgi:hypothetical protein|tara:strand:+ start:778 stop:1524 length:747 start_codon:yes stop_codon:yes gene_type:complete